MMYNQLEFSRQHFYAVNLRLCSEAVQRNDINMFGQTDCFMAHLLLYVSRRGGGAMWCVHFTDIILEVQ